MKKLVPFALFLLSACQAERVKTPEAYNPSASLEARSSADPVPLIPAPNRDFSTPLTIEILETKIVTQGENNYPALKVKRDLRSQFVAYEFCSFTEKRGERENKEKQSCQQSITAAPEIIGVGKFVGSVSVTVKACVYIFEQQSRVEKCGEAKTAKFNVAQKRFDSKSDELRKKNDELRLESYALGELWTSTLDEYEEGLKECRKIAPDTKARFTSEQIENFRRLDPLQLGESLVLAETLKGSVKQQEGENEQENASSSAPAKEEQDFIHSQRLPYILFGVTNIAWGIDMMRTAPSLRTKLPGMTIAAIGVVLIGFGGNGYWGLTDDPCQANKVLEQKWDRFLAQVKKTSLSLREIQKKLEAIQ